MLTNIGLSVIILAWVVQLFVSAKHGEHLSPAFIMIYAIGVLMLVIDAFTSNMPTIGTYNLIAFLAAIAVLVTSLKKEAK